jgi:hypothetical protein
MTFTLRVIFASLIFAPFGRDILALPMLFTLRVIFASLIFTPFGRDIY